MEEVMILLAVGVVVTLLFGLPIWALVRTRKISELESRLAGVEAALLRLSRQQAGQPVAPTAPAAVRPEAAPFTIPEPPPEGTAAPPVPETVEGPPMPAPFSPPQPLESVPSTPPGRPLEEIIGERWLGWVGISTMLFGAAFFLKYAFENQWIGELGRIVIGVMVGLGFLWFGWSKHRQGWRAFGQMFTAGGVTLLYLSVYASYGFYELLPAAAAFAFLAVIVVQAHLLAVFYRAPAIALMGQIGGVLTPVLLDSGQDRYGVLFSYLALLAAGSILVAVWRGWSWLPLVSFGLTHPFYWAWYDHGFHPEKMAAALAFQVVLFVLFLASMLLPARRGERLTPVHWALLFLNPFAFFGAVYVILDSEAPLWTGSAALLLAAVYAFLAKDSLGRAPGEPRLPWALVAVALTFVTLAIPIQLEAEWITLAWALQGVALAWLASRLEDAGWRWGSAVVLGLAVFRQTFFDWSWSGYRSQVFTPVFNVDFLGALAVAACLLATAWLLRRRDRHFAMAAAFGAIVLTWLDGSIEIVAYYEQLARALPADSYEQRRSLDWTGGMALSVLWALYASALVGGGLRFQQKLLRWSGLALFGLTVLKAFFVDIPMLEGFYRVIALITLGMLLLGAGWAYQRMSRTAPEAPAA